MSLIPTLAPLIGIMAAERTAECPDRFEDARQEGLIRVWTSETKRPDASRKYLTACARSGVTDVLRGRPSFGAPSHRGRTEPLDRSVSIYAGDEEVEDTLAALEDPSAPLAFDRAEIALARAEVRAAVARLSPEDRDLVVAYFWREQTWPEIAVETGKRTEAVRRRFVDHIAPALAEDLAHLRSAA